MIFINDSRGTIFDVKVEDKRVKANFTTGDKQQDGSYKNSYWNAVFIGHAFEKAKSLKDKDRITITKGKISNELYTPKNSDEKRTWLQITVFDYEINDGNTSSNSAPVEDKPKRTKCKGKAKTNVEEVAEEVNEVLGDDELPF